MDVCLDVGCGSGQSTWVLSPYFNRIIGTDISLAQIEEAKNFNYRSIEFMWVQHYKLMTVSFLILFRWTLDRTSPAEKLPAASGSVQLISSSQACHWFSLPTFFSEVDRVLCPGGVVALSGYAPHFTHPTKSHQLTEIHRLVKFRSFFVIIFVKSLDLMISVSLKKKVWKRETGRLLGQRARDPGQRIQGHIHPLSGFRQVILLKIAKKNFERKYWNCIAL